MRKALCSAALAAMLSMGIGTTTVAHAAGIHASQTADDKSDDDGDNGGKVGLFGLLGLLGLAGFARGGGGRSKGGYSGASTKAPKGGYTTDWSRR